MEVELPDLTGIGDAERGEGYVVESVKREEERNHGHAVRGFACVLCEQILKASDQDVRAEHAQAGREEQFATAHQIDRHSGQNGQDQVPDVQETRDHGLVGDGSDTHECQNLYTSGSSVDKV